MGRYDWWVDIGWSSDAHTDYIDYTISCYFVNNNWNYNMYMTAYVDLAINGSESIRTVMSRQNVDTTGVSQQGGSVYLGQSTYRVYRSASNQAITMWAGVMADGGYADGTKWSSARYDTVGSIHTIQYNANGGSGAPSSQKKVYGWNLYVPTTPVPTKTGYDFVEWNTKTNGSGTSYAPGDQILPDEDMTLYAIWEQREFTITYKPNKPTGATGTVSNMPSPLSVSKTYGVDITLSNATPTLTSHNFERWDTKATGDGVPYARGATFSTDADTHLYAKWNLKQYDVTFNANGGSNAPGTQQKDYGKSLTLTSSQPTRELHTFLGWSTSSSATEPTYYSPNNLTIAANVNQVLNLYAVWKLDYAGPSLSIDQCYRVDDQHDMADDGEYGKLVISYSADRAIYPSNLIKSLTIKYRVSGDTDWWDIPYSPTPSVNIASASNVVVYLGDSNTKFDTDTQYDIQVSVTDDTSNPPLSGSSEYGKHTTTVTNYISKAFFTMDFLAGGHGIAFGAPSSEEGFFCNMNADFNLSLKQHGYDVIPPNGSAGQVLAKRTNTSNDLQWINASGRQTTYYVDCETDANVSDKAITVSGWTPTTGDIVGIRFTKGNTTATPTINVNNTGSKNILIGGYYPNATNNVLKWSEHTMMSFMYNGSAFRLLSVETKAGNNQGGGTWYGICSTAAGTAAKTTTLENFKLTPGVFVVLDCTTASAVANPTLNVNSTGAIAIKGIGGETTIGATSWSAGDKVTFVYDGTYYHLLSRQNGSAARTVDVLYNNTSGGTVGTVTLTSSAANYEYMRIFYWKNGDSQSMASTTVYQPNGKTASLILVNPYDSTNTQIVGRAVSISGTSITNVNKEAYENTGNGGVLVTTDNPSVYITRVEAWCDAVLSNDASSSAVLLWTNPNPTSAFAAQTLNNIPWQNYKFLFIETYTQADQSHVLAEHYETSVVSTDTPNSYQYINSHREVFFFRGVRFPEDNKVEFAGQTWVASYNSTNFTISDTNPYVVPTKIWGVSKLASLENTSSAGNGIEYIPSTQTASTNLWTGSTNANAIYMGMAIAYKLQYAGTASNATLELTYPGGATTGAKNVYMNDTHVTNEYAAGSVILMVYDGAAWRVTDYGGAGTITEVQANGTSIATSGVANIPSATTGRYGVTQLSSATNSTSTTLAATASAVKAAYDLANGKLNKNAECLTTNPFKTAAYEGPYISKIDNALYAANKRWTTTLTGTQANGNVGYLFNGDYESRVQIAQSGTGVLLIDFTNTTYFPGYPYGYILVSFYYNEQPASVSGRVYCNYESQGIGWHDISFTRASDSTTTACVYRSEHQGYYNISQMEITITASSSTVTGVSQVELHLDRPNSSRTPFVSKYGNEELYYPLTVGGGLKFPNSTSCPSVTTPAYLLAMDAFASGGQIKYVTSQNAANTLMNALTTGSSTPVDADYYISQYVGGGTTTTTYHRRPMSALWSYISGKISSVLGLTSSQYGGNAATATNASKVNNLTVQTAVPANAVFTDTVTRVKGNSESTYRSGDVNLTAANIGAAASSHAHGNITSSGDITAAAPTVASGDCIVINDDSASKITNGPAFDANDTTKYLRHDGTWGTPAGGSGSDTKVTQTLVADNNYYPLLLAPHGQSATTTTTANFSTKAGFNPSASMFGIGTDADYIYIKPNLTGSVAEILLGVYSESYGDEFEFKIDTAAFNQSSNLHISTDKAIADYIASQGGGGGRQTTYYATCGTTASTAAKVITVTGWTPTAGDILTVLFTTANTAATPTLNVNSLGAKSIYIGGSTPNSTTNVLKWSANTTITFMYDGTYYRYLGMETTAVNTQGGGTWYGTSSTAATTAAKTSSITNFKLTPGAVVCIKFSTANTYASGAITLNVNSTGAKTIYANNAVTSATNPLFWDAGDILTFIYSSSYWYFVSNSNGYGGGAIADYIIETGETDGWHWEKWYSGKAEAWATKTHSVTINENYGNGWYSSEQHDDIPSGIFTSMEAVMLSGYGDGVGFAIEYGGGLTTTRTYSYWLMRVEGSAQPSTAYINIIAKGRWK